MTMSMIGLNRTQVRGTVASGAAAEFRLGQLGVLDDVDLGTQIFVYGKAGAAITGLGYLCTETTGFVFTMATVTTTTPGTAGFGTRLGAAQAAIVSAGFGWFQIYGKGSLRCLASAAIGTRLNTTATGGAVDDDASTGAEAIEGLVLGTVVGGAEATAPDAMFSFPTVGATL